MAKAIGVQVPKEVGYMIVEGNEWFPETWVPFEAYYEMRCGYGS